MKLRKKIKFLFPLCALALAACVNEEIVLEASQSERGRAFAESFKSKFGDIDPNHTWIDGTVGNVLVTTDQKANVVVYGLGRSDGAVLRLKRCVVEGTQEVKFDIPSGCEKIVVRAWNENGSEYVTLDPKNEHQEATLLIASGTRAASFSALTPQARQLIPNVWNQYGSIAPWQTAIPNITGIRPKFDRCQNDVATRTEAGQPWVYSDANLGMCFYFQGSDSYWYNISMPSLDYECLLPASLFADENAFLEATGATEWQLLTLTQYQKRSDYMPLDPGGQYDSPSEEWGMRYIPAGDYYNFNTFGKSGSWWHHKGKGQFYTSNIDLGISASNPTGTNNGVRLANTDMFYNMELNDVVIDEIRKIVREAEGNHKVLKEFNNDQGLRTIEPGPVSVTWFYSETTTRDYVGYYYTEGDDSQAACDAAPKYLLLEATCTSRTEGDTFPLTYYGPDGTGTPTFTFPAGVNIHFFVMHGRDCAISEPTDINPHSGPNGNEVKWVPTGEGENEGSWQPIWQSNDPVTGWGPNAVIHPEYQGSRYDWLFYDTKKADNVSTAENGWTLNPYYCCYSHGGPINDQALYRIYDIQIGGTSEFGEPDRRITEEFNGVYKPMVAFNYAGYNVVGFEDTPVQQFNGLDWNDCVFIVNGNFRVRDYKSSDLAFSMCMEDLGDTEDLDYNDLYMVVLQGYEEIITYTTDPNQGVVSSTETYYAPPRVIVSKVGGILPIEISFAPDNGSPYAHLTQVLFDDVHAAFGPQYADQGRCTINTCDPSAPDAPNNIAAIRGSYNAGEIATVEFTDGAIVRCAHGLPEQTRMFDTSTFTSEDISSFSIIDNIPNFKIKVSFHDGEKLLVSGPKNVAVNKGGNTDCIPYAFWFPSTAPNEEWSAQHPETRVEPGYERQFIGDHLIGFNEWVAKQELHGQKTWYDWCWGSDQSWPDNSYTNGGGN